MNKKRAVDFAIVFICLALLLIVYVYPGRIKYHEPLMWISGGTAVFFLVMALMDADDGTRTGRTKKNGLPSESGMITELVLLSEEDTQLSVWELYGKTAVVIGRDVKENQVDIDLNTSPYASMVEIEHAVMNYSSGNWYIEDLGSKNGIQVKKAADDKIYRLSADTPCRVERGDILYIGLNRLLLR